MPKKKTPVPCRACGQVHVSVLKWKKRGPNVAYFGPYEIHRLAPFVYTLEYRGQRVNTFADSEKAECATHQHAEGSGQGRELIGAQHGTVDKELLRRLASPQGAPVSEQPKLFKKMEKGGQVRISFGTARLTSRGMDELGTGEG